MNVAPVTWSFASGRAYRPRRYRHARAGSNLPTPSVRTKPEAVAITDGGDGGGRNFRPRRNYFRRADYAASIDFYVDLRSSFATAPRCRLVISLSLILLLLVRTVARL